MTTTHYESALAHAPNALHETRRMAEQYRKRITRAYSAAGVEPPADLVPDVSAFESAVALREPRDIVGDLGPVLKMSAAEQRKHAGKILTGLRDGEAARAGAHAVRSAMGSALLAHAVDAREAATDALTPAFRATVERLAEIGREIRPVRTLDPGALGSARRLDVLAHLGDIEDALRTLGALTYRWLPPTPPGGQRAPVRGLIVRGAVPLPPARGARPERYGDDVAILGLAGEWWHSDAVWDIRGDFEDAPDADDAEPIEVTGAPG